jgi:hypothetical protein
LVEQYGERLKNVCPLSRDKNDSKRVKLKSQTQHTRAQKQHRRKIMGADEEMGQGKLG